MPFKRLYILFSGLILASCMPLVLYKIERKHWSQTSLYSEELDSLKFELGRALFYDPILSRDSSISCSSCHHQTLAFADNKRISPGVEGRLAIRNAPSLANVGSFKHFLFDASVPTLEMQILVPIQEHAEMDFNIVDVANRLDRIGYYKELSQKVFNQTPSPYVVTRSLAHFERLIISKNNRFDQFLSGKAKLTSEEKKGMQLFYNKLNCAQCHSGPLLTNQEAMNNGLKAVPNDPGRFRLTNDSIDFGLFKVPSLRNVALTAPYMHDGRFNTLQEVLDHYQKGGEKTTNQHSLIRPFKLSKKEENQLISFLQTLTDTSFINDKKLGPPSKR